jgi:hypothetical protein
VLVCLLDCIGSERQRVARSVPRNLYGCGRGRPRQTTNGLPWAQVACHCFGGTGGLLGGLGVWLTSGLVGHVSTQVAICGKSRMFWLNHCFASRQEVRESGCTWARLVRVPAHAGSHSWGPKPNPVSASVGVARNPGGHALPTGTQANQAGLLNWLIRQTVAGGHERSIAAHKPDASRSTGTGTQDRTFSQAK